MVARQVAFSAGARESMLRGVDILAKAVCVTLGPKGRNVILDKSFGAPRITKDGVTVAGDIELENKFENMGARLVREVASKTSYVAGDGTTTAIVLAASLLREGTKAVAAERNAETWRLTTLDSRSGRPAEQVRAKILINAAGPWVGDVLAVTQRRNVPTSLFATFPLSNLFRQ